MTWTVSIPLPAPAARVFTALAVLLSASAVSAAKLEFNRDIRPILSDKCFHCHGFDPKTRKGDLRLDERAAAVADGHIVPGDAEKSLIIGRILSHDPDEVMPPPESKLGRLSESDAAKLKQWVQEGAEYQPHWSFIAPDAAALPRWRTEAQEAGARTPIDHLVTQGLKARGLKLQPAADRHTLIRRLSFDLTGLPPTPEEVTAFAGQEKQVAPGT